MEYALMVSKEEMLENPNLMFEKMIVNA